MDEVEDILLCLQQMRIWDTESVPPSEDTEAFVSGVLGHWLPLARRLGMEHELHEMQELAVKLGYPDDYRNLKKLLSEAEMTCEMVFRNFALPLRAMLDELGIKYELKYRMKSVYSIWRKMRNENKTFDDVYDLFAARIIYKPQEPAQLLENEHAMDSQPQEINDTIAQTMQATDAERFTCWRIYTVISMLYRIQTDRIKNWVSHPKPSGYQALHLTVMGPENNWVEIQIRSERMDYEAEHGRAAHWKYKMESLTSHSTPAP